MKEAIYRVVLRDEMKKGNSLLLYTLKTCPSYRGAQGKGGVREAYRYPEYGCEMCNTVSSQWGVDALRRSQLGLSIQAGGLDTCMNVVKEGSRRRVSVFEMRHPRASPLARDVIVDFALAR